MGVTTSRGKYEGTTIYDDRCWLHVRWWRNGGSKHENLKTTR